MSKDIVTCGQANNLKKVIARIEGTIKLSGRAITRAVEVGDFNKANNLQHVNEGRAEALSLIGNYYYCNSEKKGA